MRVLVENSAPEDWIWSPSCHTKLDVPDTLNAEAASLELPDLIERFEAIRKEP